MPHPALPSAPLDITEVNSFAPGLLVSQVSLGSRLPTPIKINNLLEYRALESTGHRHLLVLEGPVVYGCSDARMGAWGSVLSACVRVVASLRPEEVVLWCATQVSRDSEAGTPSRVLGSWCSLAEQTECRTSHPQIAAICLRFQHLLRVSFSSSLCGRVTVCGRMRPPNSR